MCLHKYAKVSPRLFNKLHKLYGKDTKKADAKLYEWAIKNVFKIANRNIPVQKRAVIINNKYFSPVKNFEIEKGAHYYQKGRKFSFKFNFFSHWDSKDCILISVNEGLHSYNVNERFNSFDASRVTLRAIIPKGSLYLRGGSGDIVSDNLIIL